MIRHLIGDCRAVLPTMAEASVQGRDAIMIELNPAYAAMSRDRIVDDAPLFTTGTIR